MGELFDTATHPLYSVMAFSGALIVAVIAYSSRKNMLVTKKHHTYIFWWVILFCIQDGIWGLFASHTIGSVTGLYIASYVFHFFAISSSVVWSLYFIARLNAQIKGAAIWRIIPLIPAVVQLGMLIANISTHFMFYVDEHGNYTTTDYRAIMFYLQFAVYVVIAIVTITGAFRTENERRKGLKAIFAVNLAPIIAGIFQMFYPDAPYDSVGFVLACLVIHTFLTMEYEQQVIDLRALREELKATAARAEAASNAKSVFLFNMSHDIRTPMNAILGYTAMAKKCVTDEKVARYLEKIDISGNQLLSLINQVLDMSRIESGEIVLKEQPVNVEECAEVVRIVYTEQARVRGINFEVKLKELKNNRVLGDIDRITQISNNLIGNALKYTSQGGTVTCTILETESDNPEYAKFKFIVRDNGFGMSEEYIPHLFEAFSREENSTIRKIQGTGLGMSIVKKLADLMNATIDVSSKLGEGTAFTVTIPLKIDTAKKDEDDKKEEAEQISLKGMKVLLVEDIEMNREIATDILTDNEIIVYAAQNGAEAVEMIKNSVPHQYDLILMDIQMPVMNGYEATRAIRALENRELASIPIYAMTANAFEEDKQNAFAAGMNGHISKPISVPKLLETLSEVGRGIVSAQ